MSESRKPRVALIGLGVMGKNHARVLSLSPNFELVGVVDQFASASIQTAGLRELHLEDLINRTIEVDYVVVATPTVTHSDLVGRLVENRISVLLEKPVAASLSEAQVIQQKALDSGTIVKVGFIERFNPALSALKIKLQEGLLGEVMQISTFRHGPYSSRIADVGVGLDLLSHDIDMVRWLSGGHHSNLHHVAISQFRPGFEDALEVIGNLGINLQVSHSTNRMSPTKRRETYVWGSGGMLHADSLRSELHFYANGEFNGELDPSFVFNGVSVGNVTTYVLSPIEPLLSEHKAMWSELNAPGSTQIASIEDGVEVNRVLDSILK